MCEKIFTFSSDFSSDSTEGNGLLAVGTMAAAVSAVEIQTTELEQKCHSDVDISCVTFH